MLSAFDILAHGDNLLPMSFLKAEWRKLILANYKIDPDILASYVPAKTELDSWQGAYYVSLVGFRFLNTRLLGLSIPFHEHFEEVNLRFYVRYKSEEGWRRGVVFIKEIVPKRALSLVANVVYREHYQTMPMSHVWQENPNSQIISYTWMGYGQSHVLQVEAQKKSQKIEEGSEAEFITEHYWGYTKINPSKTYEYQVTHPKWEQYPIMDTHIQVDFGTVYGKQFGFLNDLKPNSVMLAEGSEITVESRRKL